jgi:hypothetical protein
VVSYSYRIFESPNPGWRWQIISPSGEVVRSGGADTPAKAAAHAMIFWLTTLDERDAKELDPGGVSH